MAVDAVSSEPLSASNSLQTGKFTGKIAKPGQSSESQSHLLCWIKAGFGHTDPFSSA